MSSPTYCTESDVYEATGLNTDLVQNQSGKNQSEVTTLINSYILDAETDIKNGVGVPITMRTEKHLGDGEKSEFQLGPEDEEFFDYETEDCVEDVKAVYFTNERKKLPYPKNCDDFSESETPDYAVSNCTVTGEDTIKQHGDYAVKMVFSSAGYARYPSGLNLARNIDIFGYVAFWFRSSNAGVTFTLRLYDKDGNCNTQSFSVDVADIWYIIWIKIDSMTGSVDWETTRCYYFDIYANGACTAYMDNFAFNDGWIYTAPSGLLCIHVASNASEEPPSEGYVFKVTYRYDPFKASVPRNIKIAAACIAGVALVDYLRGIRYSDTAFRSRGNTGLPRPDKEALIGTRTKLIEKAKEKIAEFGYVGSYGVV